MKNLLLLALLALSTATRAQIVCIQCFDTNDSISHGVNNLVQNGSFEAYSLIITPGGLKICPNASDYNANIDHWACTGGGSLTYAWIFDGPSATYTTYVDGQYAVYFGNNYCYTCSQIPGEIDCLQQLDCEITNLANGYPYSKIAYGGIAGVSIEQTVNSLVPGNAYVLEFWAGGENDGTTFINDGLFAVDIGFGKTYLSNHATVPNSGIGTSFLIQFLATDTAHTIKFTNWGHIHNQATELVLDNVRLYEYKDLNAETVHCINDTTAIAEPTRAGISLSPNPATNFLTVSDKENQATQLIIYDAVGSVVLRQYISGTAQVNIAHLAKGLYVYEINTRSFGKVTGKVVKE